jgi:hypothetical protein
MGARAQVSSFDPPDGSLEADVANLLYNTQFEATARAAHWNCLRYQAPLTLVKAAIGTPENINGTLPAPPIPWLYEYSLPDDCLACRFVIPTPTQPAVSPPLTTGNIATTTWCGVPTSMPFVPAVDYNTQTPPAQVRVLLTNAPNAQLVYTARVDNPDLWDAGFLNALVAVLAAWFTNPLNMSPQLLQQRVSVAQALISAARIADGNEGISSTDSIPDWIQARWRSGGMGQYGNTPYIASWSSMSLPGGVFF